MFSADDTCYNGKRKVTSCERNYMREKEIITAMFTLKTKNCEGYDIIPQRILTDGIGILLKSLTILFNKIHEQRCIPEQ